MHPPEADGYPLLITAAAWKLRNERAVFAFAQNPEYVQPESRIENPVLGPDLGVTLNELNKFKRSLSMAGHINRVL